MSSFGAGNRTRTGDINLGKVALYQLSYARERRRRVVSDWGAVKLAPLSRPLTARARFLFLRTLDADAVRVQFAIEVRALHAEGVGGAADVAGELAEARQDVLLLEFVARFFQRQTRIDLRRCSDRGAELHILRLDDVALHQDGHAFDDVAQLAHVAGPVIRAQLRSRAGRKPL